MEITHTQGIAAIIRVLDLADQYEQWDLYRELLKYVREAGGQVQRLGIAHHIIQTERKPS